MSCGTPMEWYYASYTLLIVYKRYLAFATVYRKISAIFAGPEVRTEHQFWNQNQFYFLKPDCSEFAFFIKQICI